MRNTRCAFRVKLGARLHRPVDLGQHLAHHGFQFQRPLGGRHALAGAHQQGVVEQLPQAAQAVTHGRLGQVELVGGLGDVALAQQGVQVDQQVEVDTVDFQVASVFIRE